MKVHSSSCSCGNFGPPILNRRDMLRRTGMGFGSLALTWLLGRESKLFGKDGTPVFPLKITAPARNIILLHMGGGASHIDTWDPKPELTKLHGKDVPESIASSPISRLCLATASE